MKAFQSAGSGANETIDDKVLENGSTIGQAQRQ